MRLFKRSSSPETPQPWTKAQIECMAEVLGNTNAAIENLEDNNLRQEVRDQEEQLKRARFAGAVSVLDSKTVYS